MINLLCAASGAPFFPFVVVSQYLEHGLLCVWINTGKKEANPTISLSSIDSYHRLCVYLSTQTPTVRTVALPHYSTGLV
jgi:hypothetical protein